MADDEEIVRRGFQSRIDWKSHGFELLEPCTNGREAIEAIERFHPDVVMTDIYMPYVDGLAVAAHAAEHYPDITVVILSGYNEFEYAQKAIRTKVFDYVLKPVTSRDLANLLVKLKAKLDADRRSSEDESVLRLKAEKGESLLKARNLIDLVSGAQIAMEEGDFSNVFGFSPRGLACAAIVAEEDRLSTTELLAQAFAAASTAARWALPFSPGKNREAMLVFEIDSRNCDRVASSIAEKVANAQGLQATVGMGRAYESWKDASRTYQEAAAALIYRLVSGPGKAFRYAQAKEDDPASLAELKAQRDTLCKSVVLGQALEGLVEDFFATIRAMDLSPQRVRHEIGSLFASILDAFGGLGVSSATVSLDLGADYYQSAERLKTAEEAKAFLARLSAYAGSVLDKRNLHVPEWKVLDFKQFVARHFQENLSVQKVAESLSISESYLSKLVKRHLHTSFLDYVTAFRLEKAKELLRTTDLMTYEIAEAVGYPDSRYFSSIFRKRVGATPTEYRNRSRRRVERS